MLDRIKGHPEHFEKLVGELLVALIIGGGAAWLSLRFGGFVSCVGWVVVAGCVLASVAEVTAWLERTRPRGLDALCEEWRKREEGYEAIRRAMATDDRADATDEMDESPFPSNEECFEVHSESNTGARGPRTFRYRVHRYERTPIGIVPREQFIEYVMAESLYEAEKTMRRRYPYPSHVFYQSTEGE